MGIGWFTAASPLRAEYFMPFALCQVLPPHCRVRLGASWAASFVETASSFRRASRASLGSGVCASLGSVFPETYSFPFIGLEP